MSSTITKDVFYPLTKDASPLLIHGNDPVPHIPFFHLDDANYSFSCPKFLYLSSFSISRPSAVPLKEAIRFSIELFFSSYLDPTESAPAGRWFSMLSNPFLKSHIQCGNTDENKTTFVFRPQMGSACGIQVAPIDDCSSITWCTFPSVHQYSFTRVILSLLLLVLFYLSVRELRLLYFYLILVNCHIERLRLRGWYNIFRRRFYWCNWFVTSTQLSKVCSKGAIRKSFS